MRPELIKGKDGIFDVHLDDELVFSKYELFRFPESGEVEGLLRERLEPS